MPYGQSDLIHVPLSDVSKTMQDIARIFEVVYHGHVHIHKRHKNNPKYARAVYSMYGQAITVDTPLPFEPVKG